MNWLLPTAESQRDEDECEKTDECYCIPSTCLPPSLIPLQKDADSSGIVLHSSSFPSVPHESLLVTNGSRFSIRFQSPTSTGGSCGSTLCPSTGRSEGPQKGAYREVEEPKTLPSPQVLSVSSTSSFVSPTFGEKRYRSPSSTHTPIPFPKKGDEEDGEKQREEILSYPLSSSQRLISSPASSTSTEGVPFSIASAPQYGGGLIRLSELKSRDTNRSARASSNHLLHHPVLSHNSLLRSNGMMAKETDRNDSVASPLASSFPCSTTGVPRSSTNSPTTSAEKISFIRTHSMLEFSSFSQGRERSPTFTFSSSSSRLGSTHNARRKTVMKEENSSRTFSHRATMGRESGVMDPLSSSAFSGDTAIPAVPTTARRGRRTAVGAASRGEAKKKGRTTSDKVPVKADGTLYEHRWYTSRGRRVFVYGNKTYKGKSAHTMWEAVKRKTTLPTVVSPLPIGSSTLVSSSQESKKRREEEEKEKKKGTTAEKERKSDTTGRRKSERSNAPKRRTLSTGNTPSSPITEDPLSSSLLDDLPFSPSRVLSVPPSSSVSPSPLHPSVPTAAQWSPSLRSRLAAEAVADDSPLSLSLSVSGSAAHRHEESLGAFVVSSDAFSIAPLPPQRTSSRTLRKADVSCATFSSASGCSNSQRRRELPQAMPLQREADDDKDDDRQKKETIVVSSSSDSDAEQEQAGTEVCDENEHQKRAVSPTTFNRMASPVKSRPPQEGNDETSRYLLVLPKTSYFGSEEEEEALVLPHVNPCSSSSKLQSLFDTEEVTPKIEGEEAGVTHAGDFPVHRPATVSLCTTTGTPLTSLKAASSLADDLETATHPQNSREWRERRDGYDGIADGCCAPLRKRVKEDHVRKEDVSWRHRPSSTSVASLSFSSHGGQDGEWNSFSPSEERVEKSAHAGLQFIGVSEAVLPCDAPSMTAVSTTISVGDRKKKKGKHHLSRTLPPSLLVPPVTALDGSYAECLSFDALEGMNLEGMIDIGEEIGALRFFGGDV